MVKSKHSKSKPRNYAAEYERRIARGLAKGLNRSQARGHPKATDLASTGFRAAPRDG